VYDIHMSSDLVRKNFYITRTDNVFLSNFDDRTASEHIRIAINEYVTKKRKELGKSSYSPSRKVAHA